jgi:hypothetical protein
MTEKELMESITSIATAREELTAEAQRVHRFLDAIEAQLTKAGVVIPVSIGMPDGLHALGWGKLEGAKGFTLVWGGCGLDEIEPLEKQSIKTKAVAARQVPQLLKAVKTALTVMRDEVAAEFPPLEEEA